MRTNGWPLFILLCITLVVPTGWALTVKVEPKAEECFHEEVDEGTELELLYNVIDGGLLDVEIKVKENYVPILSKLHFEGRDDGRFVHTAKTRAVYTLCFNNEMARFTVKTVAFTWKSKKPTSGSPAEGLTPMQQGISRITEAVDVIERELNYLHWREAVHRNTAESTSSRIGWWSIVESVVLILMAAGQIYYVQKMVNNKLNQRV